jgi:hypothetical protein
MVHEFRGISVCPYVPNRSKQLDGWKDGLKGSSFFNHQSELFHP